MTKKTRYQTLMKEYGAIWAEAVDTVPFSNSTEWDIWSARWCNQCIHDVSEACPLVLAAVCGRTPKEWTRTEVSDYTCSEFQRVAA